jgi:hypothetical protein
MSKLQVSAHLAEGQGKSPAALSTDECFHFFCIFLRGIYPDVLCAAAALDGNSSLLHRSPQRNTR